MMATQAWVYALSPHVALIPEQGFENDPEWVKHVKGAKILNRLPAGSRVCQGIVLASAACGGPHLPFDEIKTNQQYVHADFGNGHSREISLTTHDMVQSIISPHPQIWCDKGAPSQGAVVRGDICTVRTGWKAHPQVHNCLVLIARAGSGKDIAAVVTNIRFKHCSMDWSPGEGSCIVSVPKSILTRSMPMYRTRMMTRGKNKRKRPVSRAVSRAVSSEPSPSSTLIEQMQKSRAFIQRAILEAKFHMQRGLDEIKALSELQKRIET